MDTAELRLSQLSQKPAYTGDTPPSRPLALPAAVRLALPATAYLTGTPPPQGMVPGSWLLAGTCRLTSEVLQAGCSTCGSWTWATVGLSTVDLAGAASQGLSFRERSVAFHGLLFRPSCVICRARGTRKTQAPQNVRAAASEPSAKPGPSQVRGSVQVPLRVTSPTAAPCAPRSPAAASPCGHERWHPERSLYRTGHPCSLAPLIAPCQAPSPVATQLRTF